MAGSALAVKRGARNLTLLCLSGSLETRVRPSMCFGKERSPARVPLVGSERERRNDRSGRENWEGMKDLLNEGPRHFWTHIAAVVWFFLFRS